MKKEGEVQEPRHEGTSQGCSGKDAAKPYSLHIREVPLVSAANGVGRLPGVRFSLTQEAW